MPPSLVEMTGNLYSMASKMTKGKHSFIVGRMNISAYDIISAGIWYNLEKWNISLTKDKDWIIKKIYTLFENNDFTHQTRVGVTSEGKLSFSIWFGRDYFKNS